MEHARKLIETSRPILLLAHITALTIGMVSVSDIQFLSMRFIIPVILFCYPYSIFIYGLNDYYDVKSDRTNKRKSTAFGQVHSPASHSRLPKAALSGLGISILGFAMFGYEVVLSLALLSILSFLYSARPVRLKGIPIIDFLVGGGVYMGIVGYIGYVIQGGSAIRSTSDMPIGLIVLILGGIVLHIFGAVVDRESDKKDGTVTTAVVLGPKRSLHLLLGIGFLTGYIARNHLLYLALGMMIVGASVLLYNPRLRTNASFITKLTIVQMYSIFGTITLAAAIIIPN